MIFTSGNRKFLKIPRRSDSSVKTFFLSFRIYTYNILHMSQIATPGFFSFRGIFDWDFFYYAAQNSLPLVITREAKPAKLRMKKKTWKTVDVKYTFAAFLLKFIIWRKSFLWFTFLFPLLNVCWHFFLFTETMFDFVFHFFQLQKLTKIQFPILMVLNDWKN